MASPTTGGEPQKNVIRDGPLESLESQATQLRTLWTLAL